eukprot:scaffold1448_cov387-Prasinococcus_capsulatus_cf.AAC.4
MTRGGSRSSFAKVRPATQDPVTMCAASVQARRILSAAHGWRALPPNTRPIAPLIACTRKLGGSRLVRRRFVTRLRQDLPVSSQYTCNSACEMRWSSLAVNEALREQHSACLSERVCERVTPGWLESFVQGFRADLEVSSTEQPRGATGRASDCSSWQTYATGAGLVLPVLVSCCSAARNTPGGGAQWRGDRGVHGEPRSAP